MILLAGQAVPGWLPVVIILIPVAIMLWALRRTVSYRGRMRVVKRADARRHGPQEVKRGAVAEISDPSGYSGEAMLKLLAVKPEPQGPTAGGDSHDPSWEATMLGLKETQMSGQVMPGNVLRPGLMRGSRPFGQVFIRSGPDEHAEMLQAGAFRHWRYITVLRVDAPTFEIHSKDGVLAASDDAPAELREVLAALKPDPSVWHQSLFVGGPEGIVASRPGVDPLARPWAYDLWLCERIAQRLELGPLPHVSLGERWKIPYKLGRRLDSPQRH